jgi:hypothetical protein
MQLVNVELNPNPPQDVTCEWIYVVVYICNLE